MTSASILEAVDEKVDDLGDTAVPSMGTSNFVDGSIPRVTTLHQQFNGAPHKLSSVALLLGSKLPVPTL